MLTAKAMNMKNRNMYNWLRISNRLLRKKLIEFPYVRNLWQFMDVLQWHLRKRLANDTTLWSVLRF